MSDKTISRYMMDKTTIAVPDKLRDRLWMLKRKKDSLASVIERILNFYEKNSFIDMEDDESVIK